LPGSEEQCLRIGVRSITTIKNHFVEIRLALAAANCAKAFHTDGIDGAVGVVPMREVFIDHGTPAADCDPSGNSGTLLPSRYPLCGFQFAATYVDKTWCGNVACN